MWIFVENLEVVGRHGVFAEEREEGRLFRFDLSVEATRWETGDDLTQTLDYRRLVGIVLDVVHGESVQLIETLAWKIVDETFSTCAVGRVKLNIRKHAPDIQGNPEWVGATFDVDAADWRHRREAA